MHGKGFWETVFTFLHKPFMSLTVRNHCLVITPNTHLAKTNQSYFLAQYVVFTKLGADYLPGRLFGTMLDRTCQ